MLGKYRATIHGDTITWDDDVPAEIKDGKSIDVIISLSEKPTLKSKADRRRAIDALQAIADRGGIKSIPDPDKWLREIRKDRPLPGR
jgi:hypothetical protein